MPESSPYDEIAERCTQYIDGLVESTDFEGFQAWTRADDRWKRWHVPPLGDVQAAHPATEFECLHYPHHVAHFVQTHVLKGVMRIREYVSEIQAVVTAATDV
ncbi:hypothetical protein EXIGLDRAFT_719093 [Exidia glandulosa HHB12029]|uniref:Uncharacterized protein n=1 Tax=Exidia glandulosa HHB12029 TaxID=1314781 RepID=A0A165HB31_EXIGL|nr:hypothetical protein EXIGLDRAFT_719093 [Exidia glandulosa HHB12029]